MNSATAYSLVLFLVEMNLYEMLGSPPSSLSPRHCPCNHGTSCCCVFSEVLERSRRCLPTLENHSLSVLYNSSEADVLGDNRGMSNSVATKTPNQKVF